MKRAIIIMTKVPGSGNVKTRLGDILSPDQRAQFAEVLLRDAVAKALKTCHTVLVAFTPGDLAEDLKGLFDPAVETMPQTGEGLGDRITNAFETAFGKGFEEVVMIGTDSPSVPADFIEQAFEFLELNSDVVLGPTEDGGFYLIGLRRMVPGIFENVEWSSPRTFSGVFRNVGSLGLHLREVPGWYDIDEPNDLAKLANEFLHNENACRRAPLTFRWLTENFPV